ncbi:MAG: helix-turn-helix domain-containing protein [Myxococcaceae bacterium]|nr:helix-turn-helix domain-containing protein [Myxococcaceae bacterium]MCI0670300.1 helix-turn-helix domain-containing protein [Myxococcaceae bacterium]
MPRRAPPNGREHRVAVLALDSVVPFDLGVACQVFGYWHPDLGARRYRMELCALRAGPVRTANGFSVNVPHGLEALSRAETVLVPGLADLEASIPAPASKALRAAHARGARVASICTGAFVLAAAGLLDGREATTHWKDAPLLAARYSAVRVDPKVLYVDAGRVLTSAGTAAGIDLCLHLVRSDYGEQVANAVARRLVVAPHRSGGQAQFIEQPVPPAGEQGLQPLRAWLLEHLVQPWTVDAMARRAAMSRRTFARRFRAETGTSPLQWLLQQRVLLAQRLLETTGEPVARIADLCGFQSPLTLRHHFARIVGTSPLAYRVTFRGQPPQPESLARARRASAGRRSAPARSGRRRAEPRNGTKRAGPAP